MTQDNPGLRRSPSFDHSVPANLVYKDKTRRPLAQGETDAAESFKPKLEKIENAIKTEYLKHNDESRPEGVKEFFIHIDSSENAPARKSTTAEIRDYPKYSVKDRVNILIEFMEGRKIGTPLNVFERALNWISSLFTKHKRTPETQKFYIKTLHDLKILARDLEIYQTYKSQVFELETELSKTQDEETRRSKQQEIDRFNRFLRRLESGDQENDILNQTKLTKMEEAFARFLAIDGSLRELQEATQGLEHCAAFNERAKTLREELIKLYDEHEIDSKEMQLKLKQFAFQTEKLSILVSAAISLHNYEARIQACQDKLAIQPGDDSATYVQSVKDGIKDLAGDMKSALDLPLNANAGVLTTIKEHLITLKTRLEKINNNGFLKAKTVKKEAHEAAASLTLFEKEFDALKALAENKSAKYEIVPQSDTLASDVSALAPIEANLLDANQKAHMEDYVNFILTEYRAYIETLNSELVPYALEMLGKIFSNERKATLDAKSESTESEAMPDVNKSKAAHGERKYWSAMRSKEQRDYLTSQEFKGFFEAPEKQKVPAEKSSSFQEEETSKRTQALL